MIASTSAGENNADKFYVEGVSGVVPEGSSHTLKSSFFFGVFLFLWYPILFFFFFWGVTMVGALTAVLGQPPQAQGGGLGGGGPGA